MINTNMGCDSEERQERREVRRPTPFFICVLYMSWWVVGVANGTIIFEVTRSSCSNSKCTSIYEEVLQAQKLIGGIVTRTIRWKFLVGNSQPNQSTSKGNTCILFPVQVAFQPLYDFIWTKDNRPSAPWASLLGDWYIRIRKKILCTPLLKFHDTCLCISFLNTNSGNRRNQGI